MKHIEQLEIINYQSWKYALLELHSGVNVILGSSDKGKSSIVRALNWVCTNRPTGKEFRSNFTKSDTVVTLCVDDQTVCRKKGNKINIYNINGANEDLQALRSDLPDEVKTLTNMDSINIQPQHQNYFLLDKTPGQVAKKFNEIAGLEIMDKSLLTINTEIRTINQDIKATDKSIEALDEKIKNLSWLTPCEKTLQSLEGRETQIQQITESISAIRELQIKYQEIKEEIDNLPPPEILPFIEDILDKDDNLYKIEKKLDSVKELLSKHSKLDDDIKRHLVFRNIELSPPDADRASISRIDEKTETISNLIEKFRNYSADLLDIKPRIKRAEDSLDDFKCETKFCPTCNNPWEGHSNV